MLTVTLAVEQEPPEVGGCLGVVAVEVGELVAPVGAVEVEDGVCLGIGAEERSEEAEDGKGVGLKVVVARHKFETDNLRGMAGENVAQDGVVGVDVVGSADACVIDCEVE